MLESIKPKKIAKICDNRNMSTILQKVNATMGEVVESEDSIQHWERVLAVADQMLR